MKRCLSFVGCIPLLLLVAAAQQAPAPRASRAVFSISGTTVNALTGQVLPQAQVTIAGTGSNQAVQSAITRADGHFEFHGVIPGKYALIGYKAGFPQQTYNEHWGYSSAIVVGPNLDSENLVFRLRPESSISGTIMDEAGDAVPEAQVFLFHSGSETGVEETKNWQQASSDDEGRYRFSHLPPGHYFVAVAARPWYAQNNPHRKLIMRSFREQGGDKPAEMDNEINSDLSAHAPLDVTYPVTYYVAGTDPSQARAISVNAGEHATADVTLTPVPALHVRIKNPNSETGMGVQAFQNIFGTQLPLGVQSQSSEGYTDVLGLAPGSVVLQLQQYPMQYRNANRPVLPPASKVIALDVASDVEVDPSQVSASTIISGHVTLEGAPHLPPRVVIRLRNLASGEDFAAPVSPEGDFQLESPSIQTGKYVVSTSNDGEAFLRSVTATGARVSGRILEIAGTGPVQLRISLARGLAQVNGTALHGSKPEAGVMVVLVPQHPEENPVLFRRDQSDSDGTFSVNAVVPGTYTLIAIENGWDLEWRSPAVLNSYLKKGQPVEVQAGEKYVFNVNVQ